MKGLCHQFLPGTAFSLDENGAVALGYGNHELEDGLHLLASADQVSEGMFLLELRSEFSIFIAQPDQAFDAAELEKDVIVEKGFLKVVGGSGLDRLHRGLDAGVRGDEEDGGIGLMPANRLQDGKPVDLGHADVGDDAIERAGLNLPNGFGSVGDDRHLMSGTPEGIAQRHGDGLLVIGQEHSHTRERGRGCRGRRRDARSSTRPISSYQAAEGLQGVP